MRSSVLPETVVVVVVDAVVDIVVDVEIDVIVVVVVVVLLVFGVDVVVDVVLAVVVFVAVLLVFGVDVVNDIVADVVGCGLTVVFTATKRTVTRKINVAVPIFSLILSTVVKIHVTILLCVSEQLEKLIQLPKTRQIYYG